MTRAEDLARRHARAFDGQSRTWSAAEFTTLLGSAFVHLIDHAHGFALIRVIAGEAEILTLATDPNHRRRGFGRNLLGDLEIHAHASGADTMFLEVSAANTAARALYAASGYTEISRRPGYYKYPDSVSQDALILQKAL